MTVSETESRALEALLLLYDNGWGETFASIAMRAQGVTNVNEIPAEKGGVQVGGHSPAPLHRVDWYCPACGKSQIFTMDWSRWGDGRAVCFGRSACSDCHQIVHFWSMIDGFQVTELAMHPPARRQRVPVKDERLFPDRIKGLYEEAFHNFMVGHWNACIAMCRKLVEGALKEATGTEGVSMKTDARIDAFTGAGGWADVLKHKLQVLYGAGHLGSHFDEIAPTYPMATKVMDITENILSLVYAWPATVDELDDLLKGAREAQAGQSAGGE